MSKMLSLMGICRKKFIWSNLQVLLLGGVFWIGMSSLVLENKIPHSILFPHESLHPLPPIVFGSTCFVHNFSPGLEKLSARLHKCVFLGFTRSQKGYKCFSPSLNRYFISAYVTFTKSSFYFKSLSSPIASSSRQIHISVVCDSLVMSSVPIESPPSPPLKVYSRRQTFQRPPSDSPLVPDLSSPSAPTVEPDLPVVICKGGFLPSKLVLMALLIVSKLVLWLKATVGASLLRSPRFQRHNDCLDKVLLMVVSPTQTAAEAVKVTTAATKVMVAVMEASE